MKINTCFLLVKNTTKFLITGILLTLDTLQVIPQTYRKLNYVGQTARPGERRDEHKVSQIIAHYISLLFSLLFLFFK